MIKLLEKILNAAGEKLDASPLKPFRPFFNAIDGFFFGGKEVTAGAPHIRDGNNLKRMFILVVFAALPSAAAGIALFGLRGVLLIIISYTVGLTLEVIFAVIRKEEISEGAFVTCILYPLILPPDIPLWMAALGIFIGILFGKEVFGGTGYNIFNPALVSRIFLYICFPAAMTSNWLTPSSGISGLTIWTTDALTGATPLARFKLGGELTPLWDLFWGNVSGSLGETSAFMILIGGALLIITRVADWRIPISFLGTAVIASLFLNGLNPEKFAPVGFQLLSGGMLFGAFFMATDPVTSPYTKGGRWFFAACCGLLTILIRGLSGYAEGVMFAILFMNIFTSMIDQVVLDLRFRRRKA